jgi:hypothetical protein
MPTKHVIFYNILQMEFMILELYKCYEKPSIKTDIKSSFAYKINSLPSVGVHKSHPPNSASIFITNDDTTS